MSDLKYQKLLRENGMRATPLRVAILRYFEAHHGPFSVRESYENLGSPGDLSTVYRALEAFVQKGIMVTCDFGDGLLRYELFEGGHHHHHLICTSCRRWIAVDVCLEEGFSLKLDKTGFTGISHKLEFFGTCSACQEKTHSQTSSMQPQNLPI